MHAYILLACLHTHTACLPTPGKGGKGPGGEGSREGREQGEKGAAGRRCLCMHMHAYACIGMHIHAYANIICMHMHATWMQT